MKLKFTTLQTRLYLISAFTLLIGLGSSILIYLKAGNASDNIPGYEPKTSKMYTHDLELYGGKANVLASEFSHWFVGLWQGKSLAFTVACIAIVASFGFYFIGHILQSDLKSDP